LTRLIRRDLSGGRRSIMTADSTRLRTMVCRSSITVRRSIRICMAETANSAIDITAMIAARR
jgi:hypothetical protein